MDVASIALPRGVCRYRAWLPYEKNNAAKSALLRLNPRQQIATTGGADVKTPTKNNLVYMATGLGLMVSGLLFYVIFRDIGKTNISLIPGIDGIDGLIGTGITSDNFILNSVPSFVHVLALSYLTAGLWRADERGLLSASLLWLSVNLLFEFGQQYGAFVLGYLPYNDAPWVNLLRDYFSRGVFDWGDVLGSMLAFFIVNFRGIFRFVFALKSRCVQDSQRSTPATIHRLLFACALIIGVGSIVGSSTGCGNGTDRCALAEPIYLSYEALRSPVKADKETPLTHIGKIYVYQNYLFINSKNAGVHMYDNHDPANPLPLAYINVPGNIDLAVKDGILFVDSYIDLVAIDIRDVNNIHETHRLVDVFPYNAYQNIPEGINLKNVDSKLGVVIGYRENSNVQR